MAEDTPNPTRIDDIPKGNNMPGGYVQYDVENVTAAQKLAKSLLERGQYKYFRGQRDAKWKVQSTIARLNATEREAELDKLAAFYEWAHSSNKIAPYLHNDDKLLATAQHHAIAATPFIDFTTEPGVAAWFATDNAVAGDFGAIFMIEPNEVEDVFEAMTQSGITLRFVEPDVPNLWRLQSQRGLFLETQGDIDFVWPLDRIVFPQNGKQPPIERNRIYPKDRSQLEQLLDQYVTMRQRQHTFHEFLNSGVRHYEVVTPDDVTPTELDTTPLSEGYAGFPDERWLDMDIDSEPPISSHEELLSESSALLHTIQVRRSSTCLLTIDNQTIQSAIDSAWEGMRPHPYMAQQLFSTISTLVRYLRVFEAFEFDKGVGPDIEAPKLLDSPIEIELGMFGGGSTRACVSSTRLWQSLTSSARELLGVETFPGTSALMGALDPYSARSLRLFDQNTLVDLFADEIIPWQIATRRDPVAFWPAHIEFLGRP